MWIPTKVVYYIKCRSIFIDQKYNVLKKNEIKNGMNFLLVFVSFCILMNNNITRAFGIKKARVQ